METFLRGDKIQKGSIGYDALSDDAKVLIGTNGDSIFEKGDAENSVVLKGGDNQVISEGGVALGENNLVGLKGFYYKYITLKAGGNTKISNVYLSKTQVSNPTIDTNSGASFKDTSIKPQNYWAVGDIISIVNDAKYDDIATVVQIKDGLIQIEWLDGKSPFSTVKQESDLSSEDYSIYCLDKPTQGISDLGKYSFANGTDNKAINVYTEVSGKGNVAKEKFAKVWGKDNVGGYNTTTFGTGNVNLADNSLVNGTNNINEGNNSVIHGNKNKNYGKRAFVVGNENITNNENEVAFGKYNNSENDTQFSIGIGTSDTNRKNAFEIMQDGKHYILGVGGYDGTNPNTNNDVATVLPNMVEITYSELVDLRDSSKLIPGQQYHIIDYVTTTTQSNTQSAGHQFDVIVTADDVNVLNENARAIQHEGDTYFSNSDLNAWEVKYCLDNDTERFAWADDSEDYTINLPLSDSIRNLLQQSFGSNVYIPGVIIFKYWNHKFNDPNCEEWIGIDYYAAINVKLLGDDRLLIAYPHGTKLYSNIAFSETLSTAFNNDIAGNCFFINGQPIPDLGPIDTLPTVLIEEKGKGVIYHMVDEFGNDCSYDFKNIQFARWELSNPVGYRNDFDFEDESDNWIQESTPFDSLKTGFYGLGDSTKVFPYAYNENDEYYKYKVEYTISELPTYCYTFGKDTDYSINGSNYSNVIKEYRSGNKIQLNNIVFLSSSCCFNTFVLNCYSNSFGGLCNRNSFGNYCSSNTFGNNCYDNSFSNNCSSNCLGNYCRSNSFDNNCQFNLFGNYCHSNSFGSACDSNSFGNNCYDNSFGNDCDSNSFGNGCYDNSFGNDCYSNSFGNNCYDNSFGNDCYDNSFGSACDSNSFGSACNSNSFGNNCSYNSFGNNCFMNSFVYDCDSNSFGNSCTRNSFGEYCYSNSFGNECCRNSFGESKNKLNQYYRYIIFDNGNSYINLNCTSTTSSSKYFQNVRIGLGVNNIDADNTYKTINDSNVGQTYQTLYKPTDSKELTA